jgi:hypothetical protein
MVHDDTRDTTRGYQANAFSSLESHNASHIRHENAATPLKYGPPGLLLRIPPQPPNKQQIDTNEDKR